MVFEEFCVESKKWIRIEIMKTSSKKEKGKRLQYWTCEKISKLLNIPWGPDEQIASREMGQPGCDVRLVADAKDRFPWSVECKNQEKWNIPAWIRQAKDNQKPGTDWLLICSRNRFDNIAILDADCLFELLSRISGKKGR